MNWRDKLGFGGGHEPEKKPDDKTSPQRGKGLNARLREQTEEYKEAIGLLQQFVAEGLKHARQEDDSLYPSSMTHFAELKYKTSGNRIQMRVPGHDEAKALQNIMRKALQLSDEESCPLQRQERSTVENGRKTYIVFFKTDRFSALQCKSALEAALRHIGVTPDWKGHYIETDYAAEAEFRKAMREAEEGDKPRGASL